MTKSSVEFVVPALGESVAEATVGKWFKQAGDAVTEDETLVELETDKVTLEVNAPSTGTVKEIKAQEGDVVEVGDVLGMVAAGVAKAKAESKKVPQPKKVEAKTEVKEKSLSPAVRRVVAEEALDPKKIKNKQGPNGQFLKRSNA